MLRRGFDTVGDDHNKQTQKYIKVVSEVVLNTTCETPVLHSTQAAGQVVGLSLEMVTKSHACMTVEEIMDVYQGKLMYMTISKIGMLVNLPKHQKIG